MLGYEVNELPDSPGIWQKLVFSEDLAILLKNLDDHVKSKGKVPYKADVRYQHKNGSIIWVACAGKVLEWDDDFNPIRMAGCHIDITQRKNYEAQLAHYKEMLDRTNEVARIGTWEENLKTNESIWSQVTREIHGVDETFEPGLEVGISFFPGEHRTKITEVVNKALQEGVSYDVELQIVTANNGLKWIRAIGLPEFENGQCVRLYGLFQDIDERKSAEIKIRKSLGRNKIFIEQSPMAIAMVDKDMCYIAASQQWIEDYQLQGREIIGVSHYELFPETNDYWKNTYQNCLQGADCQSGEHSFIRPDGAVQWITWDIRPWYLSEHRIGGLIMYTSDITERKEASIRLAQSEERFRTTFEHAAIGMALVSPEGRWLKVNEQVCAILGYSEEELMQRTSQDITHPADLEAERICVTQLLNDEIATYQIEKRYFHKDKSIVWALLAVSLIKDEQGKPLHFISQIKNITERKKNQQRLEDAHLTVKDQNSRLLNFAHIVSHNLRSHAGNLKMMLSFLSQESDETEKKFLLENITGISASLSETIAYLTEVVKVRTNIHQQKESLNLKHFLDKTINTLQADLRKTGGKILVEVPEEAGIIFNPAYLDSVLLNFLTNALKYKHPERKPMINIRMEKKEGYLVLFIADNGLGIDLERYGSKLFGLYKTFHEHADARGVGLFITKNQIEAMGGKIEVESTPDVGTTFKLYFCSKQAINRLRC